MKELEFNFIYLATPPLKGESLGNHRHATLGMPFWYNPDMKSRARSEIVAKTSQPEMRQYDTKPLSNAQVSQTYPSVSILVE